MHQSAWILFVIAPLLLLKRDWFPNVKIQYLLLALAVAIGKMPQIEAWLMSMEGNFGLLSEFMEESGYDNYFEKEDGDEMFKLGGTAGVGYYVELLKNIVIVWFSTKVISYNSKNSTVAYMYNLSFFGMLFHYIFINSLVVSRLNYYFYGFVYIFGAYLLHYLYHNNKKLFLVMIILYVLTFVGVLYRMYDNNSAFYFLWQSELYGK